MKKKFRKYVKSRKIKLSDGQDRFADHILEFLENNPEMMGLLTGKTFTFNLIDDFLYTRFDGSK